MTMWPTCISALILLAGASVVGPSALAQPAQPAPPAASAQSVPAGAGTGLPTVAPPPTTDAPSGEGNPPGAAASGVRLPVPPDGTGTDPAVSAPARPSTPAPATRQITVDALTAMELAGEEGNEMGEIVRVIEGGSENRRFVVVGRGTVFGFFGRKEVAVPLENLAVRGDTLILREIGDTRLAGLPAFTQKEDGPYRTLEGGASLTVGELR